VSHALERIDKEIASHTRTGEVARKLKQLNTKVRGQQESIETELALIRDAKAAVTDALKERVKWGEEKLQVIMNETLPALETDLQSKTTAWKLDSMCQRVSATNVENEDADTDPKSPKSPKSLGKPQRAIPYKPPLQLETVEKLKVLTRAMKFSSALTRITLDSWTKMNSEWHCAEQ